MRACALRGGRGAGLRGRAAAPEVLRCGGSRPVSLLRFVGGGEGRMTKIQPINPLWRGSCAPGPALTMLRARAPLPPCLLASASSKREVLAAGQMTASKAHRLARLPYRMALFLYCFTLIAYTFTKQPGATTESQLAQLPWTAASCPS